MKKIAVLMLFASASFMISCGQSAEEKQKAHDDSVADEKKAQKERDSLGDAALDFVMSNDVDAKKDSIKKDSMRKDSIAKAAAASKTPKKAGK